MLEATEITLDRLELWLSEPRLTCICAPPAMILGELISSTSGTATSPKYYYVISRSSRSRSVTPTTDA